MSRKKQQKQKFKNCGMMLSVLSRAFFATRALIAEVHFLAMS